MQSPSKSRNKAADTLRMMPLDTLVPMIERWVTTIENNIDWEWSIPKEIQMLAWEYMDLLLNRIENSGRHQRKWKPDSLRDWIILLVQKLKQVSWRYSQDVLDILDWVWYTTRNFLVNYWFVRLWNLSEIESYLENEEKRMNPWNAIKFNAFLQHVFWLNLPSVQKAVFLIKFLKFDSVRTLQWTDENYESLSMLLISLKNKQQGTELKRLFNGLPWVQRDRKPWKWDIAWNPWNILYYEAKVDVWWEVSWFSESTLWRIPWQMWPLAIRRSPK